MKKLRLFSIILALLLLFTCVASCGEDKTEFEDPSKFTGVWYSNPADGRAYIFYDDGKFEAYSVKLEEEPNKTGSGIFNKPVKGLINFGYTNDKGDFVQEYQFRAVSEDVIAEGEIEFHRQTEDTDAAVLDSYTVMSVPVEKYIGEWDNDSNFIKITINEKEEYIISSSGGISSGTFTKWPDHLIVGRDDLKLSTTQDGGLKLEGTEGTFYPAGDKRILAGPHRAFLGVWHNETTDHSIKFTEDGAFAIANASEGTGFSISAGIFKVEGGVLKYTYKDTEYSGELSNGTLKISNIEGVYKKQ